MTSALVVLERRPGGLDELSLQALAFARRLAAGGEVHALAVGGDAGELGAVAGEYGAAAVHLAEHEAFSGYAPAAVARAAAELVERLGPAVVVAAGSERGNEVLARLGALLDLPVAANCVEAAPGPPLRVTRVRWGGSLLEEAELDGAPALLTAAPHAVEANPAGTGEAALEPFRPSLTEAEAVLRPVERVETAAGGISLADAKVVVSGGRGVGSAEGFAAIEELAALLEAAVGCSRAVTMAGWRPHTDQVGQTGTKIAPDLYVACGISGATQHMAGCKGAKAILAINEDADAPILATADYAVVGDLHEVVPAIVAALREARAA